MSFRVYMRISLFTHFKLHIQFAKSLRYHRAKKTNKDKAIDNAENKCNYAIAQSGFPPLVVLVAGKAAAKSPVHTIPVVQRELKDRQMAQS